MTEEDRILDQGVRLLGPEDVQSRKDAMLRLRDALPTTEFPLVLDPVWDPSLEIREDLRPFLGSEMYQHILEAIYQGLGIPARELSPDALPAPGPQAAQARSQDGGGEASLHGGA